MTRALVTIAIAAVAVHSFVSSPQRPAANVPAGLTPVYVDVIRGGLPVPGLQRADFVLMTDGQPRPVEFFSADPVALTVLLLVDGSASMRRFLNKSVLKKGIEQSFIDRLDPGDRARIGSITNTVKLSAAFTGDKAELRKAADAVLNPSREDSAGPSPIVDAIDAAVTSLEAEAGRRVVIVVTDGRSTGNVHGRLEVARHAMASNVTVIMIGGDFPESGIWAGDWRAIVGNNVQSVALVHTAMVFGEILNQSGGALVPLFESATGSPNVPPRDEPGPVFARILTTVRRAYTLGFLPAVQDGAIHTVALHVRTPDAIVRARQGHLAR